MEKVSVTVGTLVLPTYPEPHAEEYPMFAENRVHQRSSGRPYPNKVVMRVDRSHKEDRAYKLVTLENRYLKIEILPEIGGRIYSALDKTTGYDFFYKQHVIKPALIGALGSWISGGVEFNWPFHHRSSGFMPCDFFVEERADGSAICWLSEHDPIDRMKGMVGIVLKPEEASFETRMRLYNRTAEEHSFLWWENAAVPVNETYQIFFPPDVTYVNFHYLKSRTTYPLAGNGVYNGIPMEEARDISWHKNTREATSYFASASEYDFFGGYDHGKECGVVHIGDRHISPGKKLFTWGYGQLSRSWERALTDTDGQYAELMAGSYSDNQPNFAWLAPYETKEFSQHWYPISKLGTPTFANLNCAIKIERDQVKLQATKRFDRAKITVFDETAVYAEELRDLAPSVCETISCPHDGFVTVRVEAHGRVIAEYTERTYDAAAMPEPICDTPSSQELDRTEDLYLAGVHVAQYRDPAVHPDAYWKKALERDPKHIASLIAMANYEYCRGAYALAEQYAARAVAELSQFNTRHQSGEAYFIAGKIAEAKGEEARAYAYYHQAFWAADCAGKAMTRIAQIDLRRGDFFAAKQHAETALDYGRNNSHAAAALFVAERGLGNADRAAEIANTVLRADPLDHLMRFLSQNDGFYDMLDSDPHRTCLDLAFDLAAMGQQEDTCTLLGGVIRTFGATKMTCYTLWYYRRCDADLKQAQQAPLGAAYPCAAEEQAVLQAVLSHCEDETAKMLLGCLLYSKRHDREAAKLWETCSDVISKRSLAVAYFSHLDRAEDALAIMTALVAEHPDDEELLYETVCLMDKLRVAPAKKIELLKEHTLTRDDVITELAKAYNQAFQPEQALETLLSHAFTPCEGGEHAIADQYLFAYLVLGKRALDAGDLTQALALFQKGQTLPDSLGAGLWNHCKLVPLKYHEALCLSAMGEAKQAEAIFRYIAGIQIEYFSKMHLKELPYFQAMSYDALGEPLKGQHLITKALREWKQIETKQDDGFFGTTPFFIPFVDDPARLRRAQGLYLVGLCERYLGHEAAAKRALAESVSLCNETMHALFFYEF